MGIGTALFAIAIIWFWLSSPEFRTVCFWVLLLGGIGLAGLMADANKPATNGLPAGFVIDQPKQPPDLRDRHQYEIDVLRQAYANRKPRAIASGN